MNEDENTFWFPAKRYGWGWGLPVRWQGWVVLAVYFILVIAGLQLLRGNVQAGAFSLYMLAISLALVIVCWRKGEKPGWRWGGK